MRSRATTLARTERKTQPKPGEAKELAERAQNQNAALPGARDQRVFRRQVGKRFVDHQQAAAISKRAAVMHKRLDIENTTVGVVGIDHDHHQPRRHRWQRRCFCDHVADGAPCRRMTVIARAQHDNPRPGQQQRHKLHQRLAARRGHHVAAGVAAIGVVPMRRGKQIVVGIGLRKPAPVFAL